MSPLHRKATGIVLAMVGLAAAAISGGTVRVLAQHAPESRGAVAVAPLAQTIETPKLTYWVVLRDRADLRPAASMSHDVRGRFVVNQLKATAESSQAGLRGFLRGRGADFEPFWAANVVKVTSDQATLEIVARFPEVERIEADRIYTIPEPQPGVEQSVIQAVEWNIANVRAPEVWATFGTRGEGIVVASIDTGAQFTHPALVNQYRGNLGGGQFDHNYNWYDPSLVCGNPSLAPCDNNNHGTHTMGTIAGDDGGANQIGVAPGVRWMTAKGCESTSCSLTALTAAGQWMLAPTDLSGQNPRPDLRPHIVSNSWGGAAGDTFYRQIVQSWVAAGILPVFANGNNGPACGTAGSPGDYAESYAVGAYDASNLIASFSSRGPSSLAGVKPNISAPGVNVRSSITGSSYAAYSGTSMATPHIAGIAALMWSAAASLVGDVASTRAILDQTAIDTPDSSCGGGSANNNVYGEGRVDAFAAVDVSPRGPTGTLQGTVTDAVSKSPVAGIQVRAAGPSNRTTVSNASGGYSFVLPVGTYDVTVSGFGYLTQIATGIVVFDSQITTQNFEISPAPSAALSGTVRDDTNTPIANATVTILNTPIAPATTDANGVYRFASVPMGTYDVRGAAGRCNDPQTQSLALTGDQTLDFALTSRSDSFGYSCRVVPQAWIDGGTALALAGDDAYVQVSLPFSFSFYGGQYSTMYVSTNGFVTFGTASAAYGNTTIPSTSVPNAAVYVLWDDLYVDASSSVMTTTDGVAPNRQFIVEWRNVAFYGDLASRVDLELVLGEHGEILTQYRNIGAGSGREQGNSATIGLENASGTVAFQYAANEAVVVEGLSLQYTVTPFSGIEGTVTNANDALAIASATVRVLQGDVELNRVSTDAAGYYHFHLGAGDYSVEASALNYETQSAVVSAGTPAARQDFGLRTPRAEVAPASLAFTVWVGQTAQQTLTVANTGTLPAVWQIAESGGDVAWLSETPATGTTAPGDQASVQVSVNAAGLARGTYYATLLVQSNSARLPSISVPVSLTVRQYDQAVDAGGPGFYSGTGVYWVADAAYVPNSFGYTNSTSTVDQTKKLITGTADVALYQTQRVNPVEYLFDGLTPGLYQVTLGFAEVRRTKRGARVVDISAEGTVVLPGHDVVAEKGVQVADEHVFTVTVNDGQLNLVFTPRLGSLPGIVNAIRVVQQQ